MPILYRARYIGHGAVARQSRRFPLVRRRKKYVPKHNKNYVSDYTMSGANSKRRVMNLMRFNRSPIPLRRNVVFKWSSYMNITSPAAASNASYFISLRSIYDPNYGITNTNFTNTQVPWYAELMGTAPGQYGKFIVAYVDVCIRARNQDNNTVPLLVVGGSYNGSVDYPSTTFIQNIATRTGHVSRLLPWTDGQDAKMVTMRFRVYPWQIMGLTKKQYFESGYITDYNTNAGTPPWLAIVIGDSMADGAGTAEQKVTGQIFLDYHCTLMDPIMQPSE